MKIRNEWNVPQNEENSFYNKTETLNEVIDNFNLRRLNSNEGKQLTINNVTEWCLVQTSSNPLKELDDLRKIFCPISINVNSGDYVTYENSIWIIDTNIINVDGAYLYTRMHRCNYKLKWQDDKGNIIERNILSQNASQYNNGENGNKTLILGSDQLILSLPYYTETIKLRRGKRFYIDNNIVNPIAYKLTRADTTTYVRNGKGCLNFIVTEDLTNGANDRPDLMLCDYITPTTPPIDPSNWIMEIEYLGSPTLKIGGNYKTFTAKLYDNNKNLMPVTPIWTFDKHSSSLDVITTGNEIKIKTNNVNLSGEIITLTVTDSHSNIAKSVQLTVIEL